MRKVQGNKLPLMQFHPFPARTEVYAQIWILYKLSHLSGSDAIGNGTLQTRGKVKLSLCLSTTP